MLEKTKSGSIKMQWLFAPLIAFALTVTIIYVAASNTTNDLTLLQHINDYRQENGLAGLKTDLTLQSIAQWMANDMAENNYFSHTDSLGRDTFTRMNDLGYNYNTYRGENLAAGTDNATDVFNMWKDSPPHNAAMLERGYEFIGLAKSYDETSDFGWYWAAEFGGYDSTIIVTPVPATPIPATPTPTPIPVTPALTPTPCGTVQ